MTDIIVVGLLLVIIFILISAFAPEALVLGGLAFSIIFLAIVAIIAAMNIIGDPFGSFLLALDNNPFLDMMDLMQQVSITNSQFISGSSDMVSQPVDIGMRRIVSGMVYSLFCGIGIWFSIKLFFPMFGWCKE